jgi:hypothetical protein
MPEAYSTQSNTSSVSPQPQLATTVNQPSGTSLSSAKEIWVVSRNVGDPEASFLKPITDAMTASAALLWPLIVIVGALYLRKQIRSAAASLATRIADPDQVFKLGSLELSRRINALESQVESNRVEGQVLARVASPILNRVTEGINDDGEAWRELCALADEYKTVTIPEWAERVRKKDAIATQMASLVLRKNIPRDKLAQDKDEGVRMALATVITTDPKPGDEDLVAVAAPGIQLKHVRYRFMMAVGRLAELKLLSSFRARQFLALAIEYQKNADESLLGRIDRTIQAITAVSA